MVRRSLTAEGRGRRWGSRSAPPFCWWWSSASAASSPAATTGTSSAAPSLSTPPTSKPTVTLALPSPNSPPRYGSVDFTFSCYRIFSLIDWIFLRFRSWFWFRFRFFFQNLKQKESQSLPVIMPGDNVAKFIALPCPCQPPRLGNAAVEVQKPPPKPPLIAAVPFYWSEGGGGRRRRIQLLSAVYRFLEFNLQFIETSFFF